MRNLTTTALAFITLAAAACSNSPSAPPSEEPEPTPDPIANPPAASCPTSGFAGRILIDASRDGGTWWFPQADNFDPLAPHQGEQLATYLRDQGFVVDELPRERIITDSLLATYQGVIRVGHFGSYTPRELDGYDWFLGCGRTLVLLSEFLQQGGRDQLADHLGIRLHGRVTGAIVEFGDHPVTRNVTFMEFVMGSVLEEPVPPKIKVLGRLDTGQAVMGVLAHARAKIFFLGDVNGIELVPQPLVDNLVTWGFQ